MSNFDVNYNLAVYSATTPPRSEQNGAFSPPLASYIARAAFYLHRSLGILLLIGLAVCPDYAVAPTVSSFFISPSDNTSGVSESGSLIVQFDQSVVKGSSGNIQEIFRRLNRRNHCRYQ